MFLHASPAHLIFNMLAFLSFGSVVENYFGRNKFMIFYLLVLALQMITVLLPSSDSRVPRR